MNLILIIIGLIIIILSHPKLLNPLMNRLFNEGIITPQRLRPEKVELVRYAGPNLSLFFIGIVFIIIGIIIG